MARSLHRHGVRVIVATIADWEIPLPSRAVAAYVKFSNRHPPDQFLSELTQVLTDENVDTILPMTDRALRVLAPHRNELRANHALECPSAEQLAVILDKEATSRFATSLGIPFPRTVSAGDLPEAASRVRFPVFAKLRDKLLQDTLSDPCDPVVGLANSPVELHSLFERYGKQNLTVQEYAAGDDVGLALIFAGNACLVSFQYRALRLYPSSGGVCTLAVSEPVHPELLAAASTMLAALCWDGLAQVDFRHDPSTGRFYLLEINGRFWGSTAVAIHAGADFPVDVYRRLHGTGSPSQKPYKTGLKVRWLEGDLRRLGRCYRDCGSSGRMADLRREFLQTLKSFDPRVSGMYWSWRDPAPCLHSVGTLLWYWLASRYYRLRDKTSRSHKTAKPHVREGGATASPHSTKR